MVGDVEWATKSDRFAAHHPGDRKNKLGFHPTSG
jgi:hypothetical protein